VKEAQFQLLPDSAQAKKHSEKHENGMQIHTYFCDECSSTMWRTADGTEAAKQFEGLVAVFLGCLDDMGELDRLKPTREMWTTRRTKWLGSVDGAVQLEGI